MRAFLKTILINIAILLAMIGLLVTGPILIYQTYKFFAGINPSKTELRLSMPKEQQLFLEEYKKIEMVYQDFITFKNKPYLGKYISIDQEGNRFSTQASDDQEQKAYYLFFGASLIYGYGVMDEHTIPSLFSVRHGVATKNHSVSGYSARQSLAELINLYATNKSKQKKTVIFNDGGIDILLNCLYPKEAVFITMQTQQIKESNQAQVLNFQVLLNPIKAFITKYNKKVSNNSELGLCSDANLDQAADQVVEVWNIANQIVSANKDQFIAVLPPISSVDRSDISNLHEQFRKESQKNRSQYEKGYDLIRQKITKYPQIHFIDLSHIFDNQSGCYFDSMHYTEKGNKIFADALYEQITQLKNK